MNNSIPTNSNLDEMERFCERQNVLKITQEEKDNLNRHIYTCI